MDLRELIDSEKMRPIQWVIVAMCVLLNGLDGYDVAAMSFTATRVQDEFGLSGSELGVVISATLIGMAIGSLLMGYLADRIGRRPTILLSVTLSTVGMYLAAISPNVLMLGTVRVLTGIGVGGILACVTVITSEYSSRRWRGLAIGLYTAGYGIGATVGGLVAVALQAQHGWRSVFLVGAFISTAGLAALLVVLPESVDFLTTKRPANLQPRLERIARRLKMPAEAAVASVRVANDQHIARADGSSAGVGRLFAPKVRRSTLLIWAAFFTTIFGFYFVNSWTPRLLVNAGMTADQGVTVGIGLALGGAIGSVLYGLLAARFAKERLLLVFLLLTAATVVVFVFSAATIAIAFALGGLVGLLVNGCVAGLYTVTPDLYPAEVRATGVGVALGIGRGGAILAPIIAGILLDAGWTTVQLYLAVAAVLLLAAIAVFFIRPQRDVTGAETPAVTAEIV
jgi:benzoate transport